MHLQSIMHVNFKGMISAFHSAIMPRCSKGKYILHYYEPAMIHEQNMHEYLNELNTYYTHVQGKKDSNARPVLIKEHPGSTQIIVGLAGNTEPHLVLVYFG